MRQWFALPPVPEDHDPWRDSFLPLGVFRWLFLGPMIFCAVIVLISLHTGSFMGLVFFAFGLCVTVPASLFIDSGVRFDDSYFSRFGRRVERHNDRYRIAFAPETRELPYARYVRNTRWVGLCSLLIAMFIFSTILSAGQAA